MSANTRAAAHHSTLETNKDSKDMRAEDSLVDTDINLSLIDWIFYSLLAFPNITGFHLQNPIYFDDTVTYLYLFHT